MLTNTDGGWHSDQAYRKNPATLSTLFCVIAPESGGSTSFASTRMGYESLPPNLKDRLENMKVLYSPGKSHGVPDIEVTHPAVLVNPESGVKTLYVGPGARGFEGLDDTESRALKRNYFRINFDLNTSTSITGAWETCSFTTTRISFTDGTRLKVFDFTKRPACICLPTGLPCRTSTGIEFLSARLLNS